MKNVREKQLLQTVSSNMKMVYESLQYFASIAKEETEATTFHASYIKLENLQKELQEHLQHYPL